MNKKRDDNSTKPLQGRLSGNPNTCYRCGTPGYSPDPARYPSERTCPACGATWDANDPPPPRYKAY